MPRRTCAFPGCSRGVPVRYLACAPHWEALPLKLQDRVYDHFEEQESEGYAAAAAACDDWWRLRARRRIRIDFNCVDSGPSYRGHISRSDGPLRVGTTVLAVDNDNSEAILRVTAISDLGVVTLRPWVGNRSLIRFGKKRSRRRRILSRYGRACAVPGCTRPELTLDHIVPRSAGGHRIDGNLQVLCEPHNRMKGDMSNEEFQVLLGVTW